jgi:hypothetical protein
MRQSRHGTWALAISLVALVLSMTGVGQAARDAMQSLVSGASTVPHPKHLLLLGKDGKFAASAIPTVAEAKRALNADKLANQPLGQIEGSCPPTSVDLGSWCLMTAPYPLTNAQVGQNDFFFATRACTQQGGWLPSAAELIGAANRVKLESTIHDNQGTATVQTDPTRGLQDQREMSSTLVTTAAGSDAAGSEGVSVGSTGDPRQGQPAPTPMPSDPEPATLQYVTVYSNGTKGGFAGSEPVSQPENFRCAFAKTPGANSNANG